MLRRIYPILAVLLLIFIILGLNNSVVVTEYSIHNSNIKNPFKVVLIADTHSCDYGANHEEIIDKLEDIKPDLIFLSGDIIDDDLPMDRGFSLVENIAKRFPSYYVTGNHEIWSEKYEYIKKTIASFGVRVLSGDVANLNLNGTFINIFGIDDPDIGEEIYNNECKIIKKAEKGELNFLLAHRPERAFDYIDMGVDYVFSGHAHGGQWHIPFLLEGGLFAPNQGFLPKYTKGIYQVGKLQMIVSRGLNRESTRVPRFYNPPEIVVINFDN